MHTSVALCLLSEEEAKGQQEVKERQEAKEAKEGD